MDELEKIRKEKMEKMIADSAPKPKTKVDVTDSSFDKEVLETSKKVPVVVDFWAGWCMPCTILGPVLETLADEYGGKFVLAKLDVSAGPATSEKYGIRSIPAVKLFRNGKVVSDFVGAKPEPYVRQWLDTNLG